ncbi:hypothetical protein [Candidatus Uabimicrobium amorphum]|uniref:HEAT repeat domain-containing protein n=1 Tax=Uabimicrobium amorphum TaxID=2596890 RepID=A0A5S9IL55_UABAM|nr:hypothetical protein [Candidatus Uabimicrobium amorphum]BBM83724.1 hypothetical protein UABAM_02077 [Candidatus Uabimicrobium amorphum]
MKNGWRYPTFVTGAAAFVVFLVNIVPMLVWDSVHDTSIFITLLVISSFLIMIFAGSLGRRVLFWGLFNVVSIGLATVLLFFITRQKIHYIPPKDINKRESIFRVYDELPKVKISKELTKCEALKEDAAAKIENFLQEMTDSKNEEQRTAIIKMGASAVPILSKHIQENHKSTQIFAILEAMKSQAYPIIPTLIHFIEQGEHMQEAISILGTIGNKSAVTIPILQCIVKNTAMKRNVRAKAVEALGDLGELPKDLYELLIRCCEEAPRQIAANAVRTLGKLASYTKDLEDFLLEYLEKDDMTHAAVEALQHIGSRNVLQNATFQDLLVSQQDTIQKRSEETFIAIIQRHGIDTTVLENQKLNEKVKLKIITLFLQQDPHSEYLFCSLEQNYSTTKDKMMKKNIQQVLDLVEETSTVAIPFLVKLFRDTNEDFRNIAKEKLCQMGKRATPAVPALRKMVYDKNAQIQVMAAKTLMEILPQQDLHKFLSTALRNKTSKVRVTAAQKLAEMSPDIDFAIADLEKAVNDETADVKTAAQKALDNYHA